MREIKEVVKVKLIEKPANRCDDMRLIYEVYKEYLPNIDKMSIKSLMYNHNAYELPSVASIIRYRRLLQKEYPELEAQEKIKKARREKEKEYREEFRRD